MATKTITVTQDAYEALKSLKARNESFSQTILRVAKRKPLSHFFGILSEETGKKLEKSIEEGRRIRNKAHKKRLDVLIKEMKE